MLGDLVQTTDGKWITRPPSDARTVIYSARIKSSSGPRVWQPRRRPPCKGSPTRAGQRSGEGRRRRRPGNVPDAGAGHFPASLLYPAAKLYYASTKAEVAAQLGISPATSAAC